MHTADGRLISGILTCLDKQGNIVLQHAAQHLEHSIEERHLGTVIVPKKQRMKTEAMVNMHLHPCTHGAMGNSEMCPLHVFLASRELLNLQSRFNRALSACRS